MERKHTRMDPLKHEIAPLEELESDAIKHAIKLCNWNKARAARLLGVSRRTFYRMLARYGLQLKRPWL